MATFVEGQHVYILQDDGEYVCAVVEGVVSGSGTGDTVTAALAAGSSVTVPSKKVVAGSAYAAEGRADLLELDVLNPPSILHNLRTRHAQDEYYSSGRFLAASVFGTFFLLGMCFLTMLGRSHIRKRDSIPVTVCTGFDDCCCAALCLPCVQCQLMRHEGLTGENGYLVVSPDGATDFNGVSRANDSML